MCGYVHTGRYPPGRCPTCGSPAERFVLEDGNDTPFQPDEALDAKVDIIVVGSGAAGFAAALTAKRMGMNVLMLEKASTVGGTTARSGGGFWIPCNRRQREHGIMDTRGTAIRYMARYSYPHLYDPGARHLGLPAREYALIEAYCDHANQAIVLLEEMGAIKSVMEINWTGRPQPDYMDHLPENEGARGRTLFTSDSGGQPAMGYDLVEQLHSCSMRMGIDLQLHCKVDGLLMDELGAVVGVTAKQGDKKLTYRALRGVIFGTGGFSHDPDLMLQWQRGPHIGGCAVPTNTGDFIRIAGMAGAAMGNTAGAFRVQSMPEVHLRNPGGSSSVFYVPGDSVLIVNKYGQRTMNEKRNYTDRAMTHFVWDPVRAEWGNMLQFMIFDSRTARMWQGYPPYPVQGDMPHYVAMADSWQELTEQLGIRLKSIAHYTGGFSLDESFLPNLKQTLAQFNEYAMKGYDPQFQRGEQAYDREWTSFPPTMPDEMWPEAAYPNYTMHPLSEKGPYYAIVLAAGTLDTNGGPVTNEHAQVLDWYGKPIAGLYGAGNCIASPTANAYWGAGSTIGPAITFGYLAARHAAHR